MTLLLRYWKPIAVLVAVLAVVAALRLYGLNQYNAGVAATKADYEARIARERELQRSITSEIERDHRENVSALEARISKLMRRSDAIRLCEPANVPGTAGEPASDATDGPAVRAGADIGPPLLVYGGQCEALRQQLISLREWYARQRK